MKFLASKKLSDNAPLRLVMIWMLLGLLLASIMNVIQKAIDLGITPVQWCATVLGDEAQFLEPMAYQDILLSLHTDLFGLILLFILISSMGARLNHSNRFKMIIFGGSVLSLLLYPLLMLSAPILQATSVIASIFSFLIFHMLMILMGLYSLIALMRKKL